MPVKSDKLLKMKKKWVKRRESRKAYWNKDATKDRNKGDNIDSLVTD
jgi:hypothetical protein